MKYLLGLTLTAGILVALANTPLLEWLFLFLFLGIVPGTETEIAPVIMMSAYVVFSLILIGWLIREMPALSFARREVSLKRQARRRVRTNAKRRQHRASAIKSSATKKPVRATKRRLA